MAERLTEHEAHGGIYVKHHDYISAAEKEAIEAWNRRAE